MMTPKFFTSVAYLSGVLFIVILRKLARLMADT